MARRDIDTRPFRVRPGRRLDLARQPAIEWQDIGARPGRATARQRFVRPGDAHGVRTLGGWHDQCLAATQCFRNVCW